MENPTLSEAMEELLVKAFSTSMNTLIRPRSMNVLQFASLADNIRLHPLEVMEKYKVEGPGRAHSFEEAWTASIAHMEAAASEDQGPKTSAACRYAEAIGQSPEFVQSVLDKVLAAAKDHLSETKQEFVDHYATVDGGYSEEFWDRVRAQAFELFDKFNRKSWLMRHPVTFQEFLINEYEGPRTPEAVSRALHAKYPPKMGARESYIKAAQEIQEEEAPKEDDPEQDHFAHQHGLALIKFRIAAIQAEVDAKTKEAVKNN